MENAEIDMNENELKKEIEQYADNFKIGYDCFELYKKIKESVSQYNKEIQSISYFLETVLNSLQKTFVIETCKLLDKRNDKNIFKLINILKKSSRDEQLKKDLMNIENEIDNYADMITKLKGLRDKYYTHADKEFFCDAHKVFEQYKIKYEEFEDALNFIKKTINTLEIDLCKLAFCFDTSYLEEFEYILEKIKK